MSFRDTDAGYNPIKRPWRKQDGTVWCPGDDCPKECDETCPIFLNTLGCSLIQLKEYQKALELYGKAILIDPEIGDLWNNQAACYGFVGNHDKAFWGYKKAYELYGKKNALWGMAQSARACGRLKESLECCREYKRLFHDGMLDELEKEVLSSNKIVYSYEDLLRIFEQDGEKKGYDMTFRDACWTLAPEVADQLIAVSEKITSEVNHNSELVKKTGNPITISNRISELCAWAGVCGMWLSTNGNGLTDIVRYVLNRTEIDYFDESILELIGFADRTEKSNLLRNYFSELNYMALALVNIHRMDQKELEEFMKARNQAMFLYGIEIGAEMIEE